MVEKVDLIIKSKYIVPILPHRTVLIDHVIVINQEKIVDIVRASEVTDKYEAKENVVLGGNGEDGTDDYILTAGFFNMHCHSAMTLLRGYADDVSLLDWLTKFIWPAEAKWVGEEFVELGTELACLEMIKTGTTYANEMYYYPEIAARVMERSGMRATVSIPIIKFPTIYARDEAEYLEKGERFIEQYKDNTKIRPALGPHACYTITDDAYLRVKELSERYSLPIHTHLHETHVEVADEVKDNGKRPIARLDALGILSKRLVAVHMTQLTDEEIKLVAERGVNVVHCPESNLKLGVAGICPLHKLEAAGANIAMGTDSAASNDDLDMLGELRCAAYVDKLCYNTSLTTETDIRPPTAGLTPSHRILSMASINGARALGVDHILGSLEIGKLADIVAVKVSSPPIYDPISHLVYVGTNTVTDVWVGGNRILNNTKLTTMDEQEIKRKVIAFTNKIKDIRPPTGTIFIK